MRSFLAIRPPEDLARRIYDDCAPLRAAWEGVKWVPSTQYHITLAFLGENPESRVRSLTGSLGAVVENFRAFDISFDGLGSFGSVCSPRLLLMEVGHGRDELIRLSESLVPVLSAFSLNEKRRYRPHLTLGRPRRRGVRPPVGGLLLPPDMKNATVGSFRAKKLVLYRSVLTGSGPKYSRIDSWSLKEV